MTADRPSPSRFEFVVTAGARARQLLNGSVPRVPVEDHKKTTVAKQEVLTGAVEKIAESSGSPNPNPEP